MQQVLINMYIQWKIFAFTFLLVMLHCTALLHKTWNFNTGITPIKYETYAFSFAEKQSKKQKELVVIRCGEALWIVLSTLSTSYCADNKHWTLFYS